MLSNHTLFSPVARWDCVEIVAANYCNCPIITAWHLPSNFVCSDGVAVPSLPSHSLVLKTMRPSQTVRDHLDGCFIFALLLRCCVAFFSVARLHNTENFLYVDKWCVSGLRLWVFVYTFVCVSDGEYSDSMIDIAERKKKREKERKIATNMSRRLNEWVRESLVEQLWKSSVQEETSNEWYFHRIVKSLAQRISF